MPDITHLEARGLVKTFGSVRALSEVSFRVERGECVVIEGPNGAGKSTLMALLALCLRPTRGSLHFGALSAAQDADELRQTIGYVAHASMLYPDLNAEENLLFFGELHGVRNAQPVIQGLLERFGIDSWRDRPVRTYSRGQAQRVALARALLHKPAVLLLDEPTTGLDANSWQLLTDEIKRVRLAGTMVLTVTHEAAFADAVADRRIVLGHGKRVS